MPTFVCTILGGPNGSGKSSAFHELKPVGKLINADEIAKNLPDSSDGKSKERRASEIALQQIAEMISTRKSFVLETTLSSHQSLQTMRKARAAGFKVDLHYMILDTPKRSVERVEFRVRDGGHDIPENTILQRYRASIDKLPMALRLADEVVIVDNSYERPIVVFEIKSGQVKKFSIERNNSLHSMLSSKVCEAYSLARFDNGFRKVAHGKSAATPQKTLELRDQEVQVAPTPAPKK